jgi:type IV secretory pathway VirB4 component
MDENRLAAVSNAREIAKQMQHHGFPAVIEHVNANEAYLGSIPGHGYRNVRRPLIHTRNLTDLMPTTNVWPGEETNPCPFYLATVRRYATPRPLAERRFGSTSMLAT